MSACEPPLGNAISNDALELKPLFSAEKVAQRTREAAGRSKPGEAPAWLATLYGNRALV